MKEKKDMKKAVILSALLLALLLYGCGTSRELVDMRSVIQDDLRCIVWEDRIYVPFCVVSKQNRGAQVGYVDGDRDDRVSAYKDYPTDEWLVSWIPMDGGAMLMKEESVVDIPDGLEKEY